MLLSLVGPLHRMQEIDQELFIGGECISELKEQQLFVGFHLHTLWLVCNEFNRLHFLASWQGFLGIVALGFSHEVEEQFFERIRELFVVVRIRKEYDIIE